MKIRKKTKQKRGFPRTGGNARKLKILKEKAGDNLDEPVVDKFIDENTELDPEAPYTSPTPTETDIVDELSRLDGFRDYLSESKGYNLSYGDY